MNTIREIYELVKRGVSLESVIPAGSDPAAWRGLLANYNPDAPKKKAKKSSSKKSTGQSKRSSMAAMQSALGWATVEAVKRANGQTETSEVRFVNGRLEVW